MNSQIQPVLHYGYNPNCSDERLKTLVRNSTNSDDIQIPEDELIDAVINQFLESLSDELRDEDYGKTHILPLSSGLDSRAILAGLLNTSGIHRSNIHTVTFGSPGTWDFEIGQRVARETGVQNSAVDLSRHSFDWSLDAIRDHARSQDSVGRILESYVNFKVVDSIDSDDVVIWSGFMGDPSVGGHQPTSPQENWETARKEFAQDEKYCELTSSDFDVTSMLPVEPFVPKTKLSYEEQLDFACRQQCLIKPIVIHSERYRTPFLQPSWLEFSLNIPREYRTNRQLFKQGFRDKFPKLFSLPTDAAFGLSLSASKIRRQMRLKRLGAMREVAARFGIDYLHPATNYIDFVSKFRQSGQLKNTMHTLVNNFSERKGYDWINPLSLWHEHQSGIDRSNEIRAIASAELFLSNSKRS